MQDGTAKIIYTGLLLMLISIVYNLTLLCHLPFFISPIFIAVIILIAFKKAPSLSVAQEKNNWLSILILLAGIIIITNKVYYISTKHGLWDAWGIWNMHAIYMQDARYWGNLFLNTENAHADYPLGLPGMIAFFCRLTGEHYPVLVPYAIHFFITLSIPVMIYMENQRKNIIIAAIVFILMITDEFYLSTGISQLADTMVAFYFLAAVICMHYYREYKMYIFFAMALLACCMWTKNEGLILSVVFIIFYAKALFSKQYIRYTSAGIAIPLAILILQKTLYTPQNDIIAGQNENTYHYLFDSSRYKMIYDSFIKNINEFFPIVKYGIIIYLLWCLIKRNMPHKHLLLVLSCSAIYFMVYVISPNDLEWHLFTSQSRLMQQLAPAIIYILSREICNSFKLDLSTGFLSALKRPR